MILTFNTALWNQDQIDFIQGPVVALLAAQGITYDSINCVDGVCTIVNPSQPVSITNADVLAEQQREVAVAAAINSDPKAPASLNAPI